MVVCWSPTAASRRLTSGQLRGRLARREPTTSKRTVLPSSFGGAGGLSDERPPLDVWTEAELDAYAEMCYSRSMRVFDAYVATYRVAKRRRRRNGYKTKNCEEALGGG